MIRTKVVELSSLEAVAYRRKMKGSTPGITIQRYDTAQPGLASLNKSTGEPELAANTNAALFPVAAFQEAIALTAGLPYARRGRVALSAPPEPETAAEGAEADTVEDLATIDSAEYAAIVTAYTNKKGELSYELLNKDFIQLAKSNSHVAELVAQQASLEAIRDHVVRVKLEGLTGNRNLSDGQIQAIVAMLDEVSPRYVFRELNEALRRLLSAAKG